MSWRICWISLSFPPSALGVNILNVASGMNLEASLVFAIKSSHKSSQSTFVNGNNTCFESFSCGTSQNKWNCCKSRSS
ncbi:hypothetical protein BC939DRAFT_462530 [Gamsiella multidivaricata]|uniref:uncharacterized protein n=1 Tax=Gamsiella multidivaricata TaxID=101098 RepID=UPI00221E4FE1|nr:uncharacterized protein BC939DRAFT_462530 [Gamsiella multidivaricata]KAI7818575.1 hypothetical protein BC939DRAFT_462530 [Gamsiella multidivaricata]